MPCNRLQGHASLRLSGRASARGQVLLIAVLLLGAILLLGALFVAIVQYNQFQSTRHGNVIVARNLAEAGIKYADYMLQTSSLGADWRPPKPPMQNTSAGTYDAGFAGSDGVVGTDDDYYLPDEAIRGYFGQYDSSTATLLRLGYTRYPDASTGTVDLSTVGNQGHVLLRITYDPGPPFEPKDGATPAVNHMSKYLKIEAVGVVPALVPVMRRLIAYKPIGLTDYLFWVTDKDGANKPAYFGCQPTLDFNANGALDINAAAGLPVAQRGEFLVNFFEGPLRVNTDLRFVGDNAGLWAGGAAVPGQASNQLTLHRTPLPAGGYLRDDAIEVRKGISDLTPALGWAESAAVSATSWAGGVITTTPASAVRQSTDALYDTYSGAVLDGNDRLQDPSGNSRMVKGLAAPDAFLPNPATGVDRYRAASRDIGPLVAAPGGQVHLGQLGHRNGLDGGGMFIDNADDIQFARANGTHDLQSLIEDWLRQIPAGDPRGSQSGWNAVYTVYAPPGVEIQLFPSQAAASGGAAIVTDPNVPPAASGSIWWPYHTAGEPGIRLTRHDQHWRTAAGNDSGVNTMYIDYPSTIAFGDTSASGANATVATAPIIFAEGNIRIKGTLPPANVLGAPASLLVRDYNLTVVSAGTIYIDGQILSPQDADPSVTEESNTHLALIAHDHVCLNPTMLVPQLTSGMVPAGPDDPANPDPDRLHWALSGGGTGTVYSTYAFGSAPPAGAAIGLHITHTAADPGPSGVGMTCQPAGGALTNYDFGGGALTWALMPPGTILPGPGSNTIAPTWNTVSWFLTPAFVNTAPGAYNSLSLFKRDPGVAPGSTDYWVRRFKLQEYGDFGGGTPDYRPIGSLRARVDALVYAQEGTWFIIPGSYFDPRAAGVNNASAFRRYNYRVTFHGAITENYTASPDAVRDWMDKWSYPIWVAGAGGALNLCWGSITYEYDESLRAGRFEPATVVVGNVRTAATNPHFSTTSPSFVCLWNLPRLPLLPVSPDLIYYGEAF